MEVEHIFHELLFLNIWSSRKRKQKQNWTGNSLSFLIFSTERVKSNFIDIYRKYLLISVSSVQLLSRVQLFATPWITARQVSLSITNSRSSPRLTSIESVMPSSHLILCRPLILLPPIPPSNRVFSNESTLRMRWSKYWSFSFSIIPSKEIPGLIFFRMDSQKSSPTRQFRSINSSVLSLFHI